jgi:serpin B
MYKEKGSLYPSFCNGSKIIPMRILLLFMMVVTGCAQLSGNSEDKKTGSDIPPDNNRFAFQFYQRLDDVQENLFFSPYSITSAMAMTYNGAEGKTRREMSEVFGFSGDKEKLSASYQSLQEHFASLNREDLELNIANSLWAQKDYSFKGEFLDLNRKYFSAGLQKVNFREDYQGVRRQINRWVEEKTNNKIEDLIQEGVLDRLTRLVLVNAIYFKGRWANPFNKDRTRNENFYTLEGEIQVPFMHNTLTLPYFENDVFKAVSLPYVDRKMSMIILLPHKRHEIKKLEDDLSPQLYSTLRDSMQKQEIKLAVPRFQMKKKYNLNDKLQAMGMRSAFGRGANFSAMTGNRDLYINDVVHQSFVEVNEKGTEAAAATGVVMRKTSAITGKKFKADHPFVFMIIDEKTDAILFFGRLSNPEE